MRPRTQNVAALLADLRSATPSARHRRAPFRTAFDPLDQSLAGGLRSQDLVIVGGKPGVGKTMAALQWAREMVLDGANVVYASYEHTPEMLTARLLLQELGSLVRAENLFQLDDVRRGVTDFAAGWKTLEDVGDERGLLADAIACVEAYAHRLWLVPASSSTTGVPELTELVDRYGEERTALVVDYLQKVALRPEPADEGEKVVRVADGLKDLALTRDCLVVAVAASSQEGLTAHRQRAHHLRGSSALAYEADVIVMLNEKADAVSKVHLAYDPVRAETFKHMTVFSIEKNRSGESGLDMEFQKDWAHARFVSPGRWVAERLADERVMAE